MKRTHTFSFPFMATLAAFVGASLFVSHALAQSPPTASQEQQPAPPPAASQEQQPAPPPAAKRTGKTELLDRIVLVVNEEAVTRNDILTQKHAYLQRLKAAEVTPPPDNELEQQIAERMIAEKALMQFAKETGIRIDDTTIDRAITHVAKDNNLTIEELRAALERENIPFPVYREELRKQLTLQRLREREVDSRVVVTDLEIDNYLKLVENQTGGEAEYLLSHILVAVPEHASSEAIEERHERAKDIHKRLTDGADFAQTAVAMSDASNSMAGGSLEWRTAARLPALFAETARSMKKDQISDILRSPAGFHILKLNDSRSHNEPKVVEQTHARHILVRVSETTSEDEAKQKIDRAVHRLEADESFETVARLMSDDASSSRGGDLGWINPGDTAPDFERAMGSLKPGERSEPVRTPFGWHLIEVLDRRQQNITAEYQREQTRQALRQRKSDEAFEDFLRQTRDSAYIEYKSDER